jgi:outer membrane protein assembly factor BamA
VVADVAIEADSSPSSAEALESRAREFVGAPYHARIPILLDSALRSQVAAEGRLLARSETTATVDDESGEVVLRSQVRPGPRVRIGNVLVDGNERTKTRFILDRARLEAGAILTGERLEQANADLNGTGVFRSVRIHTPTSRPTEAADVLDAEIRIAVEELEARSVEFEIGWGSYELLRGSVRYRDRNLFGVGRYFEVEPSASLKSAGLDVRFFDDYVLGRRNTLEILTGVLYRVEPSFDSTTYRLEAAVRRRVNRRLTLRGGYALVAGNAGNIAIEDPEDQEGSIEAGPFGLIEYDGRDNPLLPREGVFASTGVGVSAPAFLADLAFLELRGSASGYRPLGEDTVLAGNFEFRTRQILDDRDTLPIQNRLFLGGAQNVRSFQEDELGPFDDDDDPLGGLTTWNATVELRQRLVGDLHGALFVDVGSVGEDGFDLGTPLGYAVGAGLRYYLPMGPIRLDVAFNPGRRFAADSAYAIHFSFGFSF